MAKYSIGENNSIENIFSDKPSEVSTLNSVGNRLNIDAGAFGRGKQSKILYSFLSVVDIRSQK